jgi:hypothetical protein
VDGPFQKRLTWPGALEQTRRVAQNRPEDLETTPRRLDPGIDDRTDTRDLVTDPGLGQWGDLGSVDVTVRQVPEKNLSGKDPEEGERFSPPRSDAFEKLDLGIRPEGSHAVPPVRRRR